MRYVGWVGAALACAVVGVALSHTIYREAAALCSIAIFSCLVVFVNRLTNGRGVIAPVTSAQRQQAYKDTKAMMGLAGAGANADSALFVFNEAKGGFDQSLSFGEKIEGKASTMLTLVGGASGALGVFGMTTEGHAIVTTSIVGAAVASAAVALVAVLYVLRGKEFRAPNVEEFISGPIADADNRVGIALLLAQSYRTSEVEQKAVIRWDPFALFIAEAAIVLAALLILDAVAQASLAAGHPAAGKSAASRALNHSVPARVEPRKTPRPRGTGTR